MTEISTIQLGLTPGYYDKYYDRLYEPFKKNFNIYNYLWQNEANKLKDYKLTFYIITKKGTEFLKIKGPSISKKNQLVDYSIFLPDQIKDLHHYIDLVFEGFGIVFNKYGVSDEEALEMKNECIKELGL